MKTIELIRNYVEMNPVISFLYDVSCQNPVYRNFILRRVQDQVKNIRKNRAYRIMIEVTSVCNARCIFCPHQNMSRKKMHMEDQTFEKILQRLHDEEIDPPRIDLFHLGEPLLDKYVFQKVRILKKEFPKSNIVFTSNFALANDSIIDEFIDSGLDSIHISLNATEERTYKKIMGLDYSKTVGNINHLIAKRNDVRSPLKILIAMVSCAENAGQEKQFLHQWVDKADSVRIQRPADWGGLVEIRYGKNRYRQFKYLYPCLDLFDRIVIMSDGSYALCALDSEGLIKLNIFDNKILEAFNSEFYEILRQKHIAGQIRDIGFCKTCFCVNSNGAIWFFKDTTDKLKI